MSDSPQQFDAGHIPFLELMRVISNIAGAPFATGALLKTGIGMAGRADRAEFSDYEGFLNSVQLGANSIARIEGAARHYGVRPEWKEEPDALALAFRACLPQHAQPSCCGRARQPAPVRAIGLAGAPRATAVRVPPKLG
jgi:hypothetical protein